MAVVFSPGIGLIRHVVVVWVVVTCRSRGVIGRASSVCTATPSGTLADVAMVAGLTVDGPAERTAVGAGFGGEGVAADQRAGAYEGAPPPGSITVPHSAHRAVCIRRKSPTAS